MKAETMLRKKPDLQTSGIALVEGAAFGGLIIVTDFVDEKMGLDQTTLKSVSNALPITLAVLSTVGTIFTKGGAQGGMRDVQLMSTPFAIISIARVLRARGVFGRFFKKKANVDHSDRYQNNDKSENKGLLYGNEMSFSGTEAI